MTTQECLDTFGSSFSVSYWNGTEIVQTTALYDSTATFGTVAAVAQTDYMQPGRSCIAYTFQGSVSSSPEQIQIDIQPQYSLFDIDQLHTAILTPANATYTTPYQSPQWIWNLGGQRTVFEGLSSSAGEMYRTYVDNRLCIYCPVDWSSQSLTSGYSVRATFCSGSLVPVDGVYYIYIGVPYITYDAEGSNGTFGTTGSTGSNVSTDVNVNVTVDMDETNGILRGIPDAIAALFIPSDAAVEQFHDDMEDMAVDHLGGLYESFDMLVDFAESFSVVSATDRLAIPEFHIPLSGFDFVFGGFDMPLVYPQLQTLYTALAWLIDFLATTAFLNMCKRKLEIFFVPETEKVV